jgi:hypothetical protein
MKDVTSDYRKAYETARRELAGLIVAQEQGQRKMLVLRKTMETLSALCASQGEEVGPSEEATYMIEHVTLADELRMLLQASYPLFERPNTLMEEVKQLGRDLSKYDNPQAAIQTILQRMVSSAEAEEILGTDGKKVYRIAPLSVKAKSSINYNYPVTVKTVPEEPLGPHTLSGNLSSKAARKFVEHVSQFSNNPLAGKKNNK